MNVKHNNFTQALIAVAALLIPVVYGLVIRPLFLSQPALPLEIVFLAAAIVSVSQLFILGFSWLEIQQAIASKLSQAIPTLLLLFAIGLLVGSWIISGTIPMLIYFALKIISVEHIYFISFITPILFSLCTGTSWGSIATIGLVLITVSNVFNADLAIVTGAIVGGAYFGDKMSPLSDTTNIAAMVVKVDLYQHIHSMMYTTLPSAFLAGLSFFILDYTFPKPQNIVALTASSNTEIISNPGIDILSQTLQGISALFTFHWLLLLPPVIILIGAVKQKPPLPVLILSSLISCILAFILQAFNVSDIIQTIYKGFDISMADSASAATLPPHIGTLFNRGGLYALHEPIIITILIFVYVGTIDCIQAIPTIINRLLSRIKRSSSLVITSLIASAITNAMTSSQYANSFIVGEAFSHKYDQFKISRKVLSRSLEDTGTMIESLIPWSTTAVFVYATLGISVQEYWQWQLLSLINIPLAFIFAFFGIAWFKEKRIHGK